MNTTFSIETPFMDQEKAKTIVDLINSWNWKDTAAELQCNFDGKFWVVFVTPNPVKVFKKLGVNSNDNTS